MFRLSASSRALVLFAVPLAIALAGAVTSVHAAGADLELNTRAEPAEVELPRAGTRERQKIVSLKTVGNAVEIDLLRLEARH